MEKNVTSAGKTNYKIRSEGGIVQVRCNNASAEDKDVFLQLGNNPFPGTGQYGAVTGEKNIKDFIRAIAITGGLIKEHEDLVVKAEVQVPTADGVYILSDADNEDNKRVVTLLDGKFYSASMLEDGFLADLTEHIEYNVPRGYLILKKMELKY